MRLAWRVAVLALVASGLSLAAEREPRQVYRERRETLARKNSGGIILLFGYRAREAQDVRSPFRQESNFYYLTGWNEPGAGLLLLPKNGSHETYREILFLPARDVSEENWNGSRAAPDDPEIADRTGFSDVRDVERLGSAVGQALRGYDAVRSLLPGKTGFADQPALDQTERLEELAKGHSIGDARPTIAAMRAVKTDGEIGLIERAIDATIEAHRVAWTRIRPGMHEYEVSGMMIGKMLELGCSRVAYAPIVGSGPRGLTLHYVANRGRLESGELVLMDVGGEYGQYAADITRTVPVNGRFTPRQKELYEIVLGSEKAAIAAVRPGMTLAGQGRNSLYQVALEYLDSHGADNDGDRLGQYLRHSIGHYVGLDVHDPGSPHNALKAGMVIAIECGLYIPEEKIGIRIEDMVLVTENGGRVLSEALPRGVAEIERIMSGKELGE
jgi:Xaa-Pro aminopeptidase